MKQYPRFWFAVGVGALFAVGAFFRLLWLGDAAFRADTILFFDLCHRPLSAWTIFNDWVKLLGRTSQFPFALAFTKGCLDVFHLPVTDFMIRLPTALFGILTIPAACMAGTLLGGKRFGLFAGLLLALNPFHIQLSREAYFYPPLLLGSVLMLWATLRIFRHRYCRQPLPIRFYVLTAVGFFLLTYSHLSGWWLACLIVPFTLGMTIWRMKKRGGRPSEIAVLSAIYLIIGFPLLILPWAMPYFMYDFLHPEIKAHTLRVFGENPLSIWDMLSSSATVMAWGNTGLRSAFTLCVVVLTVAALVFRSRVGRTGLIILGLLIVADVLYYVGQYWTATGFAVRHQAFLMPLYLLLLAYGIWTAASLGRVTRRLKPLWRRAVAWVLAGVALWLCLEPAWASIRLKGQPTPYREITRWCDTRLPPRTPVLVDRWLESWNELKVHNSTNVVFTYTIPSEPLDVFLKYNWRETAKQFFAKYPDAAYLEIMKQFWEKPEVGSWDWPRRHFARRVVFTNEPGMTLRRLGCAYREDFYMVNTNRLVVELFYNTPDDIVTAARGSGKTALVLFGQGWNYTKTQDFRDWRMLEKEASLDVYNLTDEPQRLVLKIAAIAVGAKEVQSSEGFRANFENQKPVQWSIDLKAVPPGRHQVKFTDSLWELSRIPLLVDRVEVEPGQE